MKTTRILSAAFIAAALVGCSQEEQFNMNQDGQMQFMGSFEQMGISRVTMDSNYDLNWEGNEQVSIFPGMTVNNQYQVSSVTDGRASFSFVDYVEAESYSKLIPQLNYALYPYDAANSIAENGTMTASVPAGFTYDNMANSIKTALMAAKSPVGNLNFKNVQGILRLKLNAVQPFLYGAVESIQLESASQNLSGKVNITFDGEYPVATWVEGGKVLTLDLSAENKKDLASLGSYSEFYLPMVPAQFAANDVTLTINWANGTKYEVVVPINFNIERRKIYTLAHTLKGGTSFEGDLEGDIENPIFVATIAELQEAINNATGYVEINVAADITGDAVVPQKEDVNITILGQGFKFNGMITVDGKSAAYPTAGLTIKDLNFAAEAISGDACVRLGGTNATRYTSNVTVENCTFDVPSAVGVKSYTGGDVNLAIKGCTATDKTHSLVQAAGIEGILIKECEIYSKNGMNFNNSNNVAIEDCTAEVRGYAARFGQGSSSATGASEAYSIKNSTLKSENEEGDAVIILRGSADNATLTIESTTIEGTPGIANNAVGAKVTIDGNVVATSLAELQALIDSDVTEITLADGVKIEGTLTVNKNVTIKSNPLNKATIVGRVNISGDASFNNIKFAINDASKVINSFSGANYKYPGIAMVYAAEASFEGCDFVTDIASGVCGINYGSHTPNKALKVNNCTFKGDFYAIRSRTLFSVTNSKFDIYTSQGKLAAIFTWGNGNSGADSVIFTGNENLNENVIYGVQLSSTTFSYDNMTINVQGNTNFERLDNSVNPACTFADIIFAAGSETF